MRRPNAIVPETPPPENPQNLGEAPSPSPTIRERSTKQPWLPVEKTTWDNWRFMLRARRVRVNGPRKTHVKLFYLAMAAMTDQLLKGVDIGTFALPIHVILFDLQLSKTTFYKLRRELQGLGLMDWKQRRNRSTEYRVMTRRDWAAKVTDFDNRRIPTIGIREDQPLGTYVGTSGGASARADAPSHSSTRVVLKDGTGGAPRLKAVAPPSTDLMAAGYGCEVCTDTGMCPDDDGRVRRCACYQTNPIILARQANRRRL